jgi:hypothetical protein
MGTFLGGNELAREHFCGIKSSAQTGTFVIKGTVSRNFRPWVFFTNQTHLGIIDTGETPTIENIEISVWSVTTLR